MLNNLNDKVVLITGSTKGIGKEIARDLCKNGATVITNYKTSYKDAQEFEKLMERYSNRFRIFQGDVSNEKDMVKIKREVINEFGKI